jgi:hypothetical protein
LYLALLRLAAAVSIVSDKLLKLAFARFDSALDSILEIRLGLLNFARLGTKDAAAVRLAA